MRAKNVGSAPDLFAGPGGLSDSTTTIETFLANEVEGPAAPLLRALCAAAAPPRGNLPPEVMRYLAWAASRSLVMQRLETKWAARFEALLNFPPVEPPPDGLMAAPTRRRPVRLMHPTLGERLVSEAEDASSLLDFGWVPDLTERANFLGGRRDLLTDDSGERGQGLCQSPDARVHLHRRVEAVGVGGGVAAPAALAHDDGVEVHAEGLADTG